MGAEEGGLKLEGAGWLGEGGAVYEEMGRGLVREEVLSKGL